MTKVRLYKDLMDYDECVKFMDDDIREDLHDKYMDEVTEQEFLDLYVEGHEKKYEESFRF